MELAGIAMVGALVVEGHHQSRGALVWEGWASVRAFS